MKEYCNINGIKFHQQKIKESPEAVSGVERNKNVAISSHSIPQEIWKKDISL